MSVVLGLVWAGGTLPLTPSGGQQVTFLPLGKDCSNEFLC